LPENFVKKQVDKKYGSWSNRGGKWNPTNLNQKATILLRRITGGYFGVFEGTNENNKK
jgi:hypothetical protein